MAGSKRFRVSLLPVLLGGLCGAMHAAEVAGSAGLAEAVRDADSARAIA